MGWGGILSHWGCLACVHVLCLPLRFWRACTWPKVRYNWTVCLWFFLKNSLKNAHLFLAALGLCCRVQAFSNCGEWGKLSSCSARAHCDSFSCCGARALGRQASVAAAHRLSSCRSWAPEQAGSVVVAHRMSCSRVCGIFLDQGSNPYPLHWQVDS